MNIVKTSNEEILEASLRVASKKGVAAISIRAVADEAGVSIGSVYNYFPNKSVLVTATVRQIWTEIFHKAGHCQKRDSVPAYIQWIFNSIKDCSEEFPDFLYSHTAGFIAGERKTGRETMERYFSHLRQGLKMAINKDPKVNAEAFDESFTEDEFSHFVFSSLLTLLTRGETDCNLLIKVVERVIYM